MNSVPWKLFPLAVEPNQSRQKQLRTCAQHHGIRVVPSQHSRNLWCAKCQQQDCSAQPMAKTLKENKPSPRAARRVLSGLAPCHAGFLEHT